MPVVQLADNIRSSQAGRARSFVDVDGVVLCGEFRCSSYCFAGGGCVAGDSAFGEQFVGVLCELWCGFSEEVEAELELGVDVFEDGYLGRSARCIIIESGVEAHLDVISLGLL